VLLAEIEALSKRQPVFMVFEDAHWIDPTSLEALDLLIDRIPSLPVRHCLISISLVDGVGLALPEGYVAEAAKRLSTQGYDVFAQIAKA
jgi:predicted ATPase